jgi:hypothetical protein
MAARNDRIEASGRCPRAPGRKKTCSAGWRPPLHWSRLTPAHGLRSFPALSDVMIRRWRNCGRDAEPAEVTTGEMRESPRSVQLSGADDGPEHMLQSETEYIDSRPHQPASTKGGRLHLASSLLIDRRSGIAGPCTYPTPSTDHIRRDGAVLNPRIKMKRPQRA